MMWADYGNTMVLGGERVVNESVSPTDVSTSRLTPLAAREMKTQAAHMPLVPGQRGTEAGELLSVRGVLPSGGEWKTAL
jgi:hypothetical protein